MPRQRYWADLGHLRRRPAKPTRSPTAPWPRVTSPARATTPHCGAAGSCPRRSSSPAEPLLGLLGDHARRATTAVSRGTQTRPAPPAHIASRAELAAWPAPCPIPPAVPVSPVSASPRRAGHAASQQAQMTLCSADRVHKRGTGFPTLRTGPSGTGMESFGGQHGAPHRWHSCRPQTVQLYCDGGLLTGTYYCACGAATDPTGRWHGRNTRRYTPEVVLRRDNLTPQPVRARVAADVVTHRPSPLACPPGSRHEPDPRPRARPGPCRVHRRAAPR